MRAPRFWSNPPSRPGLLATLLAPLSVCWQMAGRIRATRTVPGKAGVAVLCVGNLTAGGAGKSPMVAALLQRAAGAGIAAHVVSRGHGGTIEGPHRVDPLRDTYRNVGDEPLMLSAFGPVWVSRDRLAGARAAAGAGAALVILDDGFQNPRLVKDASLVMVDAGNAFGNGRVIPAGPLREPISEGLSRADAVILIGSAPSRRDAAAMWPVLQDALPARLVPQQMGMPLAGERVIAFAGIGRPAKFFETVREIGAVILEEHGFADHYAYPPAIIRRLIARARAEDALLVTTEKDAVRLPPDLRRDVLTVQVCLDLEDWGPIDALLAQLSAK